MSGSSSMHWGDYKIFIVDDMSVNIKILTQALNFFAPADDLPQLFTYQDPLEALEAADKVFPDLFLLDIEMPGINGIELCEKLKSKKGFKYTPVIFITSLDNVDSMQRAYDVGANDFINKPFNNYEVFLRVKSALTQYSLLMDNLKKESLMKHKAEDNEALVKILCHDFANSLTAVKFLVKDCANEKLVGITENMIEVVEHVRQMISLESGASDLQLVAVDLFAKIEKARLLVEERLQEKNLKLVVNNMTTCEKVGVKAEPSSLLNQVLLNLLTNAIKFSYPGGEIRINVAQFSRFMIVEIKDFGMGIPPDMIGNVFNKYVKTTSLGTNKEKGTGFGLPLVKQYMQLYGGDIKVSSICIEEAQREGTLHGTTFTLFFPAVNCSACQKKTSENK